MHAAHSGRKFGFAYAASDYEEILKDKRVNTVAILSRHDTHAELAVKALKAGKHVFVEKPLALDEGQLKEIQKALAKSSSLLTVGFNRRFAPFSGEMKRFLEPRSEAFMAHYRVNAGYIPLNHWLQGPGQGGGRLIGEGCHFVDFLTFLAGAAPVSVYAQALPDNGKYREDNFTLTLNFPDGSIGTLEYLANGDKSFPKERVEVFCAGRIAVLDDFRSLELVQDGRRRMLRKAQDKGWTNEWLSFTQAIVSGGEAPIPYEQLFGVTRATFAAVDSIRSGKVISL
jgi:predicted dehydrogenase